MKNLSHSINGGFTYAREYGIRYHDLPADADDYARLMLGDQRKCPFWRNGDEYAVVRHQM